MKNVAMIIACAGLAVFFCGCVRSSGALKMGKNSYSITTNGPAADAKKQAYQEAAEFCEKDGLEISVIDENMNIRNVFGDGTYELKFQCLPK